MTTETGVQMSTCNASSTKLLKPQPVGDSDLAAISQLRRCQTGFATLQSPDVM